MITIETQNIRGCHDFKIEIEEAAPVALICGWNGAGKSTHAEILRRVLTGIWPDTKEQKEFLRIGATQGSVIIKSDTQSYELTLPGKPVSTGWPEASQYASGWLRFAEQKAEAKAAFLQTLLKTEPTKVDLAKEIKRLDLVKNLSVEEAKKFVDQVWENKERKGWAGACKDYDKRRLESQAQWKQITGSGAYPRVNASTWTPENYESTLEGRQLETLEKEVKDAETLLQNMHRFDAVQEQEIETLREQAEKMSELAKLRDAAIKKEDELEERYKEDSDKFKRLPRPAAKVVTKNCPHPECGRPIDAAAWRVPPAAQTEAEVKEIEAGITAAEEALKKLGNELHLARNSTLLARENFFAAERAANRLRELEKAQAEKPPEVSIKEAERKVELAKQRLEAFKLKTAADAKVADVARYTALQSLFEPDGWRSTFTTDALKRLNEDYLKSFCEDSDFPEIKIDRSQEIWFNGGAYRAASEGQRYRVDAFLQIAFSQIEGAHMLVFDALELMDHFGRFGLLQVLANCPIPSICFWNVRLEQAPDLEKQGLGRTYWLDKSAGKCLPLADAKAVAV